MSTPSRHTLTLELELDGTHGADDIAGRLTDGLGHGTDFVGWLGLASAIESLAALPAVTDESGTLPPKRTPCQRP